MLGEIYPPLREIAYVSLSLGIFLQAIILVDLSDNFHFFLLGGLGEGGVRGAGGGSLVSIENPRISKPFLFLGEGGGGGFWRLSAGNLGGGYIFSLRGRNSAPSYILHAIKPVSFDGPWAIKCNIWMGGHCCHLPIT